MKRHKIKLKAIVYIDWQNLWPEKETLSLFLYPYKYTTVWHFCPFFLQSWHPWKASDQNPRTLCWSRKLPTLISSWTQTELMGRRSCPLMTMVAAAITACSMFKRLTSGCIFLWCAFSWPSIWSSRGKPHRGCWHTDTHSDGLSLYKRNFTP